MSLHDAITLRSAREVISAPRVLGLTGALNDAVGMWRARHQAGIGPTTRANTIADLFYWNITTTESFIQEDITPGKIRNQRYIVFDERVLLRFKLLGDDLESSNYPTEQAEDFVRQEQIEGFPPFDRLHFGYRLDLTGLYIKDAFITLPTGNAAMFNAWVWQVWGDPLDSSIYTLQAEMEFPGYPQQQRFYYEDYSKQSG